MTLEQTRIDVDRVAAVLSEQYPDANRHHGAHVPMLDGELSRPTFC